MVKIDITGFTTYFDSGKVHPEHPHVMIPLQGHFKGETGKMWHLLPIVWKTHLGIEVGVWAGWMRDSLREQFSTFTVLSLRTTEGSRLRRQPMSLGFSNNSIL